MPTAARTADYNGEFSMHDHFAKWVDLENFYVITNLPFFKLSYHCFFFFLKISILT